MKKIDTYINEKLHLNKDFKINKSLHEDDVCAVMSATQNDVEKRLEINMYHLRKIISISSNEFTYTPYTSNGNIIKYKYFVNSNDFYEAIDETDEEITRIIMPIEDGIKLLKYFKDDNKDINKYLYDNYFDKDMDKWILDESKWSVSLILSYKLDRLLKEFNEFIENEKLR